MAFVHTTKKREICTVVRQNRPEPKLKLSYRNLKKNASCAGKPCISEAFSALHLHVVNLFYSFFSVFLTEVDVRGVCTVAYSTAADRPSIFSLAGREPSCCDPTSLLWSKNSVKALGEGGGMKYEWIQLCFDGYVSKYPSKRLLKARKSVCVVEIGSSSPVSTPASSRVAFHFIF